MILEDDIRILGACRRQSAVYLLSRHAETDPAHDHSLVSNCSRRQDYRGRWSSIRHVT